jgi:hypothetical protein
MERLCYLYRSPACLPPMSPRSPPSTPSLLHPPPRLHCRTRNSMSDDASCPLHDLTDSEFLTPFNSTYPQNASWKLWTPTPSILSAVTLSLAAQEAVRSSVTAQCAARANTHWWQLWSDFCDKLAIDALLLSNLHDPVALLQVFTRRYRTGTIAPKSKHVRSRTIEDALRSVGQTFAGLGKPDPRLTSNGNIDFRIQRMLSSYKKKDPPPNYSSPSPPSHHGHRTCCPYAR